MLQSIHSTIKLFRKPAIAESLIVALNPYLEIADAAILTYNADVLTDMYLTCLNMWSLPLQRSTLIGLPTFVLRSQTGLLHKLIVIIMGELIRVFEFYSSGYSDLSNAPPSEALELIHDVVQIGQSLYALSPQSIDRLFNTLEGTSQAVDKFQREVEREAAVVN